jgi:hypothetical protein
MDAIQPASLPSGEPASGSVTPSPTTAPKRMTLREAVKAGVNSLPQFNGSAAPSPASDDLADFDTSASQAPAKATQPAGKTDALADEPGDGTVPRPVEGHQDGQASKDPLAAPARWPEDRRKAFEALPEDAKRILLEREKEFNTGLTQNAQKAAEGQKRLEAINGLFQDHHRQEMQAAGYDEVATVKELLGRHDAWNRDPVGYGLTVAKQLGNGSPIPYLTALIKQAGITQEMLFGPSPNGQQQPGQAATPPQEEEWVDPKIVELEQKLATYDQFIQAQKDREQQEIQRQQQEQRRSFDEAVYKFETATNEDGSPKYPHVSAVANEISRLVKGDPALHSNPLQTLEAAYNQAIYLHPEIRQQIMEEEFSKRLTAKEKELAAQKALRAAPARPSPGSAGGSVNRGRMSIKEAAKAAVARHVNSSS